MPYSFSCGDVMPGCAARFTSDTEDDLLTQVGAHAAADHQITEISPEVLDQVRARVVES